ncbi:chitin binding peritrophin-A domain-containing protein [Phthorimaea operculella]|nr:chitin binding peritrophin-A domain-containing protein [Phthorimaea operculella]
MKVILAVLFLAVAAYAVPQCPPQQADDWSIEKLLRHTDCNKFYKCTYGVPVEQDCVPGLHFNLATWECDWPENVDYCDEDGEKEIEFLENGCPVDPHIHWLLPHESECNLFYYCVWGRKELRECSASLHFNRVLQFLKNGCPVDPHIHWLLPHESECNLFYYCVWGRKELRECSASLHFNRVLQCLKVLFSSSGPSHPLAAASRVRVQPLLLLRVVTQGAQGVFRVATLQQSAPGVEVQPPLQQTASGQCHFSFSHWNKEIEFLENGCPVDPHIHWLLPEVGVQPLLLLRVGTQGAQECSASLHFNKVLQFACKMYATEETPSTPMISASHRRRPALACLTDVILRLDSALKNGCPVDPHIHWLLPQESECNLFYYCVWGRKELRECSASLHFNRVLQFLENGCPVDPHIHWLLPHESECNLFYYCVWGRKELRECSASLHFNKVLQVSATLVLVN